MPSFLQEHCLQLSRVIPPNICEELIQIGKDTQTEYGQIGGSKEGIEDHYTRKSGVAWLDRDAKLSDGLTVFDHITPHVRQVNEEFFKSTGIDAKDIKEFKKEVREKLEEDSNPKSLNYKIAAESRFKKSAATSALLLAKSEVLDKNA